MGSHCGDALNTSLFLIATRPSQTSCSFSSCFNLISERYSYKKKTMQRHGPNSSFPQFSTNEWTSFPVWSPLHNTRPVIRVFTCNSCYLFTCNCHRVIVQLSSCHRDILSPNCHILSRNCVPPRARVVTSPNYWNVQ